MGSDRLRTTLSAAALIAIAGLALFLRFEGLSVKPLHSDESVNGWFSLRLYWWNVYQYQPADYHGPFLYYVNLVAFWLLGPSEFSLRLGTALVGGLTPLLLWPLRPWLGRAGVLLAGAAIAVAPAMVYYSRTVIHETYLLAFTLVWIVGILEYLREPRIRAALLAAAGAAGCFCNKETALITGGGLAFGLALALLIGHPGRQPQMFGDLSSAAALRTYVLRPWSHWLAGLALFFGSVLLFFTSFFSYKISEDWAERLWPLPEWVVGFGTFFSAFGPWIEHGTSGRNQGKSWSYFLTLMQETQGGLLWFVLAALFLSFLHRRGVGLFLSGWLLSSLLVYSAVPYKTPWCVLNLDLPSFLLAGWGLNQVISISGGKGRGELLRFVRPALLLLVASALFPLANDSLRDVRDRYDDDERPWVYVQTQRGFLNMMSDHFGVAAQIPGLDEGGPSIINIGGKNPARWYSITRGWDHRRSTYRTWKKVGDRFLDEEEIPGTHIVVAVGPVKARVSRLLDESPLGWHREIYPLRPGWQINAWYRQKDWDAYQDAGGRPESLRAAVPTERVIRPPKPRRFVRPRPVEEQQSP